MSLSLLDLVAACTPHDDRTPPVLRVVSPEPEAEPVTPPPSVKLGERVLAMLRLHPNSTALELAGRLGMHGRSAHHDSVADALKLLRRAGKAQRTERRVLTSGPSSGSSYLWWAL